jgi:hypothetical protein
MSQNILLSIVFMLVSTMAFAQAQAFDLTLQPLNLLSNRIALPRFDSPLDFERRGAVPAISPGRLTLQTLPFALDPIAARTFAPQAISFAAARRVPYPELFLRRLRPLQLLSHRLFVPKFNSLMGRAGLFRLQRASLVSSAENRFYRPPDADK